jgi:hypothetical protein
VQAPTELGESRDCFGASGDDVDAPRAQFGERDQRGGGRRACAHDTGLVDARDVLVGEGTHEAADVGVEAPRSAAVEEQGVDRAGQLGAAVEPAGGGMGDAFERHGEREAPPGRIEARELAREGRLVDATSAVRPRQPEHGVGRGVELRRPAVRDRIAPHLEARGAGGQHPESG